MGTVESANLLRHYKVNGHKSDFAVNPLLPLAVFAFHVTVFDQTRCPENVSHAFFQMTSSRQARHWPGSIRHDCLVHPAANCSSVSEENSPHFHKQQLSNKRMDQVETPGKIIKKQPRPGVSVEALDDFTRDSVRQVIYKMYHKGQCKCLGTISKIWRDSTKFTCKRRSTNDGKRFIVCIKEDHKEMNGENVETWMKNQLLISCTVYKIRLTLPDEKTCDPSESFSWRAEHGDVVCGGCHSHEQILGSPGVNKMFARSLFAGIEPYAYEKFYVLEDQAALKKRLYVVKRGATSLQVPKTPEVGVILRNHGNLLELSVDLCLLRPTTLVLPGVRRGSASSGPRGTSQAILFLLDVMEGGGGNNSSRESSEKSVSSSKVL
uniref:Uncharacterized protein n=1 Tax=Timema douglasi TaxID=61478 RepID=A0A7R8Z740_TIMDO|nr:unnamed protein product [Timema douglasi]